MNQHNIGENKASVKVHNNPGGQSSFSLYWNEPQKTTKPKPSNIAKYRNESHFAFGGESEESAEQEEKRLREEEKKKAEELARKKDELNNKLPSYDPRQGGKGTIFFGNQPTDYRKKEEVYTSVKVKNPPGGRSNIQFG